MLAERGVPIRVASARNTAERGILGEYYLVDQLNVHIVIRDHIDLNKFAEEIGAVEPGEEIAKWR
jgi:hypothetical protein